MAAPVIMAATLILVVAGVALAWVMYVRRPVATVVQPSNVLVEAARHDLYQDNLNEAVAMRPGKALADGADRSDRYVIDGVIAALVATVKGAGKAVTAAQNGYARSYAAYMLVGVVALLIALVAAQI